MKNPLEPLLLRLKSAREGAPPIFRSRLFWIICACTAIGLAIFIAAQTRWIMKGVEQKVRTSAEQGWGGHQARFEKLSTNFFNSVSIKNLEISNAGGFQNGTLLKAERLRVLFKPSDLIRMARGALGSGAGSLRVELVQPTLELIRTDGRWNWPKIQSSQEAKSPIVLELRLKRGELRIQDQNGPLDGQTLQDVSGELVLGKQAPLFELTARSVSGGSVEAEGHPQDDGSLTASMRLRGLSAGDWLYRFCVPPSSVTVTALLDADVDLRSPWPPDLRKASGKASMRVGKGSLGLHGNSLPLMLEADAQFTGEKIEAQKISITAGSSEIQGSGAVLSPFQKPQVQVILNGSVSLKDWAGFLPKETAPQGLLRFSMTGVGPLKQPEWKGESELSGAEWRGDALSAKTDWALSTGTLRLRSLAARWGAGTFHAEAALSRQSAVWKAELLDIPLSGFSAGHKIPLGGRISAKLTGSGAYATPRVEGSIAFTKLSWAGFSVPKWSGRLRWNEGRINANLKSPNVESSLSFEAVRDRNVLTVRKLRAVLPNGDRLTLSGKSDLDKKTVKADASAQLSPGGFEPLVPFLAHVAGKVSASGQVSGPWRDMEFNGRLSAQKLYFKDRAFSEKAIGVFSSKLIVNRNGVDVADFNIGQGYFGTFRWRRDPAPRFDLTAKAQDADPKILFLILNIKTDLTGKLSGQARLSHVRNPDFSAGEPAWNGQADLTVRSGRWGQTGFDALALSVSASKNGIQLQRFSWTQPGGRLTVSGKASQTAPENPLELSATAKNFMAGDVKINGSASAKGRLVIEPNGEEWLGGKITAGDLEVNGFAAGVLTGDVRLKKPVLDLSEFRWGDSFTGDFRMVFGVPGARSPGWEGRWTSTDKEMSEWAKLLDMESLPLSGRMVLSGEEAGSVAAPEHRLSVQFSDLRAGGPSSQKQESGSARFEGGGRATLSNKMLRSLALQLRSQDGAKVNVTGQANLKDKRLGLNMVFSDLEAGTVFRGMGWTLLNGKSEGALSVEGDWTDPVVRGEFRGREGSLGEIPLESWQFSGRFQQKELLFSHLKFVGRKNSWRFSLLDDSWIRPQDGAKKGLFRLSADFANLSVGPVRLVGGGLAEGIWEPDPSGGAPVFQGTIKINQLSANNFDISPTVLRARYTRKSLQFLPTGLVKEPQVSGAMNFANLPCILFNQFTIMEGAKRIFLMDGVWCRDEPSFKLEGTGVDAELFSSILESPLTVQGKADMNVTASHANRQPAYAGRVSLRNGTVEEIPLEELDAQFQWKDGIFSLDSFQAKSKNYFNVSASGAFPLKMGRSQPAPGAKINFTAKLSNGNLSFLNFLESDWVEDAKGQVSGQVSLRGKTGAARLDGDLNLSNAEFNSRYLDKKAEKVNLKIQIQNNQARVQQGEASVGLGKLRLSGSVSCVVDENGFAFDKYNLKLQTLGDRGIPIQVPELPTAKEKTGLLSAPSRGTPSFEVQWTGRQDKPKLSGWVQLDDTRFSYPPVKKDRPQGATWPENMELDLDLRTGKRTMFENELVSARILGELKIFGTRGDVSARGRITSEEGKVTLYGTDFDLRQAVLEIDQPQSFTLGTSSAGTSNAGTLVHLQFRAEQQKQLESGASDTITLAMERTLLNEGLDTKKIVFRSAQSPDLSPEKVAARAGIGFSAEGNSQQQKDYELKQGIARLIDSQLAIPILNVIGKRTGLIDEIQVTQNTQSLKAPGAQSSVPTAFDPLLGTTFAVKRNIGPRLDVTYKATLDKIQDRPDLVHELQLQYYVLRGVRVFTSRELDSRETLGRDPDLVTGVNFYFKFDPSDWLSKKDKKSDSRKK